MRLSILDQSPVSLNQTSREALNHSLKLAQIGESLGYTRYWLTEHHDLQHLASSTPEVLLGYIGGHTETIRIGAGAILLPHYRPYKVAEIFNTLATLFPNRIDLGIGRAPGGSAEATNALSTNYLQKVFALPELLEELLNFLDGSFPDGHEFKSLSALPKPEKSATPWLLGTSEKSAKLAAKNGLPYTFGYFMSDNKGTEIIQTYKDNFVKRYENQEPEVILTVSVVCAETNKKAEEIALSSLIWSIQKEKLEDENGVPSIEAAKQYKLTDKEKEKIENMKRQMIIGDQKTVKTQLKALEKEYECDEIMINTVTYSPDDKFNSYCLIAEVLL